MTSHETRFEHIVKKTRKIDKHCLRIQPSWKFRSERARGEYERRPRSTATDTETGLDDYGFHSEEVDLDLHGSVVVGEDEDPSLPSTSTSTSASTSTTPRLGLEVDQKTSIDLLNPLVLL